MNWNEFKSRKDLQITALISFLIGCLLGMYGLILFTILTVIYLLWRYVYVKKQE